MAYWKILASYTRPVRGIYSAAVMLETLSVLASIGVIFLQQIVIDDIFAGGKYEWFVPIVLAFAGASTVYFLAHAFAYIIARRTEMKVRFHLSRQLLGYFHRIPIGTFRSEKVSRLSTYFWSEIDSTADYVCFKLMHGLVDVVRFAVISGIVLYYDWRVYGMIVACGFYLAWNARRMGPKLKQASKGVYERNAEMSVVIEESIASSREVIAYDRSGWERSRLTEAFGRYFGQVRQELKLTNRNFAFTEPARWAAQIGLLGFAGWQVIAGSLTIGMLVVLYGVGTQLIEVIGSLFRLVSQTSSQMAAVDRLNKLVDGPRVRDGHKELAAPIRTIAFEDVRFGYSEAAGPILRGVRFEIAQGGTTAFVGPSGAGKSTIVQLLTRLYDPSDGSVTVNGSPLAAYRMDSVLGRIGVVLQEPFLFPDTIRNNLAMGQTELTDESIREACHTACIDEFIDGLPDGYDTLVGERGLNLSGGQRQRLAVARALLQAPEVLVLDEATSALDQETERVMQERIRARYPRLTQIVIAHRLTTVKDADKLIVLDEGRVAGQGSYDELYERNGLFRQLVDAERERACPA